MWIKRIYGGQDHQSLTQLNSGNMQASENIALIEGNIRKSTKLLKLDYAFNPVFKVEADTAKDAIRNKMKEILLKLEKQKEQYEEKAGKIAKMVSEVRKIETQLKTETDIYTINKLQSDLIKLKQRIRTAEENLSIYKADQVLVFKHEKLKEELEKTEDVLFSGVLSEIVICD